MTRLTLHAPAKLNLFLAITGRRSDGFHNLVSLAVPLDFGDELELCPLAGGAAGEGGQRGAATRLRCVAPAGPGCEVPASEDNLVLRAAAAFRAATGFSTPVEFVLKKRVPVGAGLGGGSSDAVAALRGLNTLLAATGEAGRSLDEAALGALAAQLGADCAFFVHGQPAIMRGRGERVERLGRATTAGGGAPAAASTFLRGQRLFLCKPAFGVNTAWAYAEMWRRARSVAAASAAAPASGSVGDEVYLPEAEAEALCARWSRLCEAGRSAADPAAATNAAAGAALPPPPGALTFNNMEPVVFAKYPALPVLAAEFRERFGLTLRMSGSGSACFAFLPADAVGPAAAGMDTHTSAVAAAAAADALVAKLTACVHEFWGRSAFTRVVQIAAA